MTSMHWFWRATIGRVLGSPAVLVKRRGLCCLMVGVSFNSIALRGAPPEASDKTASSAPDDSGSSDNTLLQLSREYALRIETKPQAADHLVTCLGLLYKTAPASPERVREYAPLLAEELRRYPRAFLKRLGLRRIVLCGRIKDGEFEIGGFAAGPVNSVYLNIGSKGQEEGLREGIHHELAHILDYHDGAGCDAEWRALNLKAFRYTGSKSELWQRMDRGGEGFLIADGTRNLEEDKAHYFSFMVTHYAAVRDLGQRDHIVRAKADLMERTVSKFCPAIDASFWAEAMKRTEPARMRVTTQFRLGWLKLEAGTDPLESSRRGDGPFVLVRRTAFPNYEQWSYAKGRMTAIGVPFRDLVRSCYGVSLARCIAPAHLTGRQFDLIVSLPDIDTEHDPAILEAVRREFERTFGLTARKEKREMDVYMVKLGPHGTRLLDAASKRGRIEKSPNATTYQDLPEASPLAGGEWRDGRLYFTLQAWELKSGLAILEQADLDRPLIDLTGFSDRVSVSVPWGKRPGDKLTALGNALGLDIVETRQTVEVTILEEAR